MPIKFEPLVDFLDPDENAIQKYLDIIPREGSPLEAVPMEALRKQNRDAYLGDEDKKQMIGAIETFGPKTMEEVERLESLILEQENWRGERELFQKDVDDGLKVFRKEVLQDEMIELITTFEPKTEAEVRKLELVILEQDKWWSSPRIKPSTKAGDRAPESKKGLFDETLTKKRLQEHRIDVLQQHVFALQETVTELQKLVYYLTNKAGGTSLGYATGPEWVVADADDPVAEADGNGESR